MRMPDRIIGLSAGPIAAPAKPSGTDNAARFKKKAWIRRKVEAGMDFP
jgi:hypothetical protein